VAERAEDGRRARASVPRSAHGEWLAAEDRLDPVGLIEAQNRHRLGWLVPVRHARMLASPFAFFRGAAAVMAADLGQMPSTDLVVQMAGDAHLANFGTYASPERQLVFDANDFDETLPGPFEWDVKRLIASVAILGRERGFPRRDVMAMTAHCAETYRLAMQEFAQLPVLELWYRHLSFEVLERQEYRRLDKRQRDDLDRVAQIAHSHDHLQAVRKFTEEVDGELRIRHAPPLLFSLRDLHDVPGLDTDLDPDVLLEGTIVAFERYKQTLRDDRRSVLERFRPLDVGIKVVGVGSVGTRCLVLLLEGHDRTDPLFLQVKEATAAVYERYRAPSPYDHHGRRVVEGQRLGQAVSDIFLGWTTGPLGHDYYVRQLRDWKYSPSLGTMPAEAVRNYAGLCAWTLARGHARSGDAVAIAAYLGTNDRFDRALSAFAQDYADRNQQDYEAFRAAADDGRIPVADTADA
jgi:uncharacterized protein (DUF2252 family)